jgi:hypothetical protein
MISAAKDRWYVPDPNRARDLENLREAALHKEFEIYKQNGSKKLRIQVKSRWATDFDGGVPVKNLDCDFVVFVALNRAYRYRRRPVPLLNCES